MKVAGYLVNTLAGVEGEKGLGYQYILARNGLFVEAESRLLQATIRVAELEVRGLAPMQESVSLKHGLVPRYLWERAWEVLAEDPYSERYLAIVWGPGGYDLAQPSQEATSASVQYDRPRNVVVDMHSHGTLKPFFSTTDDKDDQGFQISIVTGEMDKPLNTFIARACVYGYFAPVRPGQVFQREGKGKQCIP